VAALRRHQDGGDGLAEEAGARAAHARLRDRRAGRAAGGASTSIKLQDFVIDGVAYLPVFSSKEAFERSTQGRTFPYEVIEIDRLSCSSS
jgi:hypothetical protein